MLSQGTLTEIEGLLIELIKTPSFSGQEKEIGNFVIRQLKGFKVRKQFVGRDRFNIIAAKGESKKWLVAHMDTVLGEIPMRITEEKIFGRGACDNKQSIAASIIVGNQLKNINLLFTVGEEKDFIGARTAQKAGVKGDLMIIQEPTDFKVITGQNGVITFAVRTKGKKQHSSLVGADSAIHKLADILFSLKRNNWILFNIGQIEGGIAPNVVADKAEAIITVRPRDIKEYSHILNSLRKVKAEIVVKNNFKPCRSGFGFPELISPYFTEMAFFENSIQYGAGDIKFAHSDKEQILRKDLNLLPEKLIKLLESIP